MIRADSLMGFLRQLMPIRLRRSKSLTQVLLQSLVGRIDAEVSEAQEYTENLLNELQYTSQVQAFEELVLQRYDDRVELLDENENGNVLLFAAEAAGQHDYRKVAYANITAEPTGNELVVLSVERTDVGCGFTVIVHEGEDADEVGHLFAGLFFWE